MIEIAPLTSVSAETLYATFSEAFANYDAPSLSKEEFFRFLKRRGFSAESSFGAFDNGRLVSFTFNGIGMWNGEKTAYDTGTGTLSGYRGQGLAGKVFQESLPDLRSQNVSSYLLEVLQQNTNAISVYLKQGFEVTREFNYSLIPMHEFKPITFSLPTDYSFRPVDLHFEKQMIAFHDFKPSWQNSFDSIRRNTPDFDMIGLFHDQQFIGYGIIERLSGDITQIAIDQKYRSLGLAKCLLGELVKYNRGSILKFINTERGYAPMEKFLAAVQIPICGQQFEMMKKIL